MKTRTNKFQKDVDHSRAVRSIAGIIGLTGFMFLLLFTVNINDNSSSRIKNENTANLYKLFSLGNGPGDSWKAPASADTLKNPYKDDIAEIAKGKALYQKMCVVCHGNGGKGDGPAGIALNPRPADHTSPQVQDQSDGALFWKMKVGKAPMAAYKDILTEEQLWDLVNYIRTLKK